VAPPIPIALRRINTAAQLEGVPDRLVRQVRVKAPVNKEAEPRQARWIAAPEIEVERIAPAQAAWTGAEPVQARWIGVAAVQEETRSGIEASLPPPAAEAAARSAAARAVRAGVPREPAAAEALPAMAAVLVAAVGLVAAAEDAAAVEDGGK